jgi:signal transduction histidine kinase
MQQYVAVVLFSDGVLAEIKSSCYLASIQYLICSIDNAADEFVVFLKQMNAMCDPFKIRSRFLLLLLLAGLSGFCQTARIDSIKNILNNARLGNGQRLTTLFSMCGQYNSLHPDSLWRYIQAAKQLATSNNSFADIATAVHYETIYFGKKGKTDSALQIIEKNLSDKKILALPAIANKFRLSKTGLLIRQNKMKEALENALEILHEAEKNNVPEEQLKAQIQIGWIYMELNQYNDALKWFFEGLELNKRERKLPEPSVVNSNIAAVYNSIGKNDSAAIYINRSIEQAINEQDLSFLCNAYYISSGICVESGRIAEAEELLKKGLEIRKKIDDAFYIVADLAELGRFYINANQHEKGIATIQEGIAIATANHFNTKLLFLYPMLAESYKATNDLANYSNTLNKIIQLKDTLYSQNSAEAVSELQTKYELQKKENTIIQQRFDLVQKTYWMYGIVALLLFGAILWYINYTNNKRKQEQKMAIALMEEKRISEKAILVAQEQERKRIAADLHDNLGAYAAAISSNIDYLTAISKNEQESKMYDELKKNSQAIVSQLNDTIWVLTKEVLALTAISDRLKVFIQRLYNSYPNVQIDVEEKIETDHLLAPMQALHLFKILQEAIINALKHSGCSRIVISIESDLDWKITINDNGNGFTDDPSKPTAGGGNGLHNMKNRSRDAGWNINWQAINGGGTRVQIATAN